MKKILFVIGGEKSGKSSFALMEGQKFQGKKAYLATAIGLDDEMKERIERHKMERGPLWTTFEEPLKIVDLIMGIKTEFDLVLIDCLTIWVSNLFYYGIDVERECERIVKLFSERPTNLIVVSNEVGLGIVPDNPLARKFRTQLGVLNQNVAKISDRVIFMVSGIPCEIKRLQ
ncbi:MAG: bifunctional adenosylcobinamide kinase/adenosylcobinamide-phosphate guanylyltransferase [Desulfobacterota bacterium]|nr:bifunctional adenosylcobinamide kinase/adenosylcobinamide-phosphate guanylyltransferase [Thermodesulfobacteriota bacterium]MDW8002842.1 bifunctional adenosylcobinamide kinase/adenosylcobinamide-phosphate guanylyltransferase [Deltaproteobacteria bacterium]